MIEKTLKRITRQLELFAKNGVSLLRALDLMEASTQDLEEIVCLNTLRESLSEKAEAKRSTQKKTLVATEQANDWATMGLA